MLFDRFFQKGRVQNKNKSDYKILSLSGGGVLGLYTAKILEKFEEETGQLSGESFNLICGTSIGGMIALSLSKGVPAKDIVLAFYENAEKIFTPREDSRKFGLSKFDFFTQGTTRAKFNSSKLKDTMDELIGSDAKLGDAEYPVLITSYDISTGSMRLFCSPFPNPDGYHDLDVLMSDVALASSAVPVIFPIHQINEHRFVDGGVFANAPDIVALQKAIFHLDVPMEKIKMCSIGTMTGRFFLDNQIHNDAGIISWGRNKRLPTLMMSAQQQFTTSFMRDILQERYLRIDTLTSDPDVEIFSYQKKDLDKICNLAKNSWNALDKEKLFKEILG